MSKTLFDHVRAIYENQDIRYFDDLDEVDKKSFQTYMINRTISMIEAYTPFVNEFQNYGIAEPRTAYLFYSQLLPKKKQFGKYIKRAKIDKQPEWMIDVIANHFSVSKSEATTYIEIYYGSTLGKVELRSICEGYATDPKLMKKADLDV